MAPGLWCQETEEDNNLLAAFPAKCKSTINVSSLWRLNLSLQTHGHQSNNNINGSFQGQINHNIGPSLWIIQVNIEGKFIAKNAVMCRLLKTNDVNVSTLQETHVVAPGLCTRIPGYTLVVSRYHPKYGLASYDRKDMRVP